jgi:predicted cobalt transporter CbtA
MAMDLALLGKIVLGLGLGLALFGAVMLLVGKGLLPHLPGDLAFRVGNVRVFFPIATSIVISVLLTVVLNLLMRR